MIIGREVRGELTQRAEPPSIVSLPVARLGSWVAVGEEEEGVSEGESAGGRGRDWGWWWGRSRSVVSVSSSRERERYKSVSKRGAL